MMWTVKYAPKSMKEIINQKDAVAKIYKFLKTGGKPLLLYGPPGVGKTCSVYAIANDLNMEVLEINASQFRDSRHLRMVLGNAIFTQTIFVKKRVILLDEVDTFGAKDRGGIKVLNEIIKSSSVPVILVANDPWLPSLRTLRAQCEMVEFKRLTYWDVRRALIRILSKEKIEADKEVINYIAKNAHGDLRAAINDLETIAAGKKKVTKDDLELLTKRLRQTNIFDALRTLFKTYNLQEIIDEFSGIDMEPDEIIQWIAQNLPYEYEGEDLWKAFNLLSRADVFLGRITRRQYYDLLVYVSSLYEAVAFVKSKVARKWVGYKRPIKFTLLAKEKQYYSDLYEFCRLLAKRLHTSAKVVRKQYLPLIKTIFNNDEEKGRAVLRRYRVEGYEHLFIQTK